MSALAICGALVTLSSGALAQTALTERLRVQGGYITEARPAPLPRTNDVYVGAVPELALSWVEKNKRLVLDYQLTGALHTLGGASEIANRLALSASFELTPRTTLLLSGYGAQTTLNNFLVSQPASGSTVGLLPAIGSRIITGGVAQSLLHELSPRVRVDQHAAASVVTTLAPTPPLDTFFVGGGAGIERVWLRDGLGAEASALYAIVRATPPTPDQNYATFTAGPRWRHDWSRTISSLVTAGATGTASPDPNSKALVSPFARGALLYTVGDTSADVTVSTAVVPSPLTGQVTQAHQATLHGITPLSQHARVYCGASIGYVRGRLIDRVNRANEQTFDTVLTDVDLTWQAAPLVQLFARYQFAAQVGEAKTVGVNPSFLRDAVLVGVVLSSRPPEAISGGRVGGAPEVPTRLPQRVDRADGRAAGGEERGREGAEDPGGRREAPPEGSEDSRWIHTTPAQPPHED